MTNIIKLIRNLQATEDSQSSVDTGQLLIEIGTNALLFTLIFGMAGTVDIRNLKKQLRNRYAILTGIGMQFVIMPFLGFVAVKSLKNQGLTTSMGLTLLIVTASPGGSYSNWWCSLFNADLALSVAMTALSTILSIGLLPANLMLYAHAAYGEDDNVLKSVDFMALFISLGIVIGAILSGLYASYKINSTRFHKVSNAIGSFSGLALIVVSGFFSTNGSGDSVKPWEQKWSFYVGVSMPCVVGLLLANIIAKCANLEKPEVVTLSIECCYQNVGIAASAVLSMFDDKEKIAQAMAVPLLYGLVEAVVLGLYCLIVWKLGWTKAPKQEKICVVLAKTYEIDDDDEEVALQDADHNKVEGDDSSKAVSTAQTMTSTIASSNTGDSDKRSRLDTSSTIGESSLQSGSGDEFRVPDRLDVVQERVLSRNNSEGLSYSSNHSGVSFDDDSGHPSRSFTRWSFLSFRRSQTASAENPLPDEYPTPRSKSEDMLWRPHDLTERVLTAEASTNSSDHSGGENEC